MPAHPPIVLSGHPSPDAATSGELRFVGTATVLLRLGGFTLLTDPNFLHQGEHAPLGGGLRSKRLTEPAMQVADLPPLDLIVLSHHHGDHFDERAARDLPKDVPIVTTAHAIPIHYDDYTVFESPLEDFRKAAARAGLSTEIHYLERGDTFRFDPAELRG